MCLYSPVPENDVITPAPCTDVTATFAPPTHNTAMQAQCLHRIREKPPVAYGKGAHLHFNSLEIAVSLWSWHRQHTTSSTICHAIAFAVCQQYQITHTIMTDSGTMAWTTCPESLCRHIQLVYGKSDTKPFCHPMPPAGAAYMLST